VLPSSPSLVVLSFCLFASITRLHALPCSGPDACAYESYGPEKVDTPEHRQLALEAATQGIVLLANNPTTTPWGKAPLLPLQGSKLAGRTVAVIGPNAPTTQVSAYTPSGCCLWWR
jgi:beta-glucosidase-like glycosyl hydrolase